MSAPKIHRKRATAEQMAVRKVRVGQWLQSGLSYDDIAGLEGISRKQVRRIVVEALKARQEDMPADRRLLDEFMLAPALRLAAKAINEGKLEGIDRLVKVIDRLEKFRPATPRRPCDENARQKLLAKRNRAYDRMAGRRAEDAEKAPELPVNL